MKYAACTFSDKPGSKTYDYALPFDAKVGDIIKVPKDDGFRKVHVVEIKDTTTCPPEYLKTAIEVFVPETEEKE